MTTFETAVCWTISTVVFLLSLLNPMTVFGGLLLIFIVGLFGTIFIECNFPQIAHQLASLHLNFISEYLVGYVFGACLLGFLISCFIEIGNLIYKIHKWLNS